MVSEINRETEEILFLKLGVSMLETAYGQTRTISGLPM